MPNDRPGSSASNRETKRNLLRVSDLNRETFLQLIDRAGALKNDRQSWPTYPKSVVGLIFMERSTRTLVGFQSAVARVGGTPVVLTESKRTIGMSRGESFEDTIKVVSAYCDLLIVRHPRAEALEQAANVSSVPIINAGNGIQEHPSQAVIDLFAMRNWHGSLDGLRVGIVGDLQWSRSAHSLVHALAFFAPAEVRLMYPEGRGLPTSVSNEASLPMTQFPDQLELRELDVLYMAGLPEGQGQKKLSAAVRSRLRLTPQSILNLPDRAVVLSPLPRIDEIDKRLDRLPNACYFGQSSDALFVRIAILDYMLRELVV